MMAVGDLQRVEVFYMPIAIIVHIVTGQYSINNGKLQADFSYSQLIVTPSLNGSVHKLRLDNNNLIYFNFTEAMPELEEIILSTNEIEVFPDLRPAPNLTTVDVSTNRIRVVDPMHLEGLASLLNLYLKRNRLTSFPDSAIPSPNLEMLDLSFNEMTHVPQATSRRIILSYNEIVQVRLQDLLACPKTVNLNLRSQPITRFVNLCSTNGAENVSGIQINMMETPVSCDCALSWTKLWTKKTITHTCNGQTIQSYSVSFADFNCKGGSGGTLWTQIDFSRFFCTIPQVDEQLYTLNERVCTMLCMSRPSCVVFGMVPPGPSETRFTCLLTGDSVDRSGSATSVTTTHPASTRWYIISNMLD